MNGKTKFQKDSKTRKTGTSCHQLNDITTIIVAADEECDESRANQVQIQGESGTRAKSSK